MAQSKNATNFEGLLFQFIGYLAYEFLDGKLIRPEAIKVIQINTP